MLESVAICGDSVHGDARRALIAGYLEANVKDHRPSRFLLNDLVRYWRTIAVDFESKMRARKGEGWGLRMPSSGSCVRPYSPAGFSRSSSATGNQPATCSTTSMSACRSPRLTGSPTRSSIAAPSTPAYEHATPTTSSWRFSTTARSGGS
jgi:hypothetical protein